MSQLKRTGNKVLLKGGALEDAIAAAITAMNEPKTCSTTILRRYLLDANKDRKQYQLGRRLVPVQQEVVFAGVRCGICPLGGAETQAKKDRCVAKFSKLWLPDRLWRLLYRCLSVFLGRSAAFPDAASMGSGSETTLS